VQIFGTKMLCAAFLLLRFGFEIFWRKNIGAKGALKMLMKLTIVFGLCFSTICVCFPAHKCQN